MTIFWYIVLGAISGWVTFKLMKKEPKGFIKNLILGATGGFVGSWLFKLLNISEYDGKLGFILTAVIGGAILVWVADLLSEK